MRTKDERAILVNPVPSATERKPVRNCGRSTHFHNPPVKMCRSTGLPDYTQEEFQVEENLLSPPARALSFSLICGRSYIADPIRHRVQPCDLHKISIGHLVGRLWLTSLDGTISPHMVLALQTRLSTFSRILVCASYQTYFTLVRMEAIFF